MNLIDWAILFITLFVIIVFGIYKNRKDKNIESYLLGNQSLPWYHVGFSVMATQASAVTFLSAPGQGYVDGMRFVQFYLGLPLAMIVLSVTFIPIFHRLKVYTAYEYLETRFDSKVRIFTAILFLFSRSLSTGISIYAPSIILSTIFGWDIVYTNIFMGGIVLIYTVVGGTKAISYTHLQQMFLITLVLFFVGYLVVKMLPSDIGMIDAIKIAGKTQKMKVLDLEFNPNERYNLWSGLIGGFFLQLSYFGTDQSQVGRYLTGKSIKESRLGLIMNGFLKIPMQFGILLIGVLVYVFYLFNNTPTVFNQIEATKLETGKYSEQFNSIKDQHQKVVTEKKIFSEKLNLSLKNKSESQIKENSSQLNLILEKEKNLNKKASDLIKKNNPEGDANDINYIFLRFVIDYLPHGLIGLMIALIFSASMGSIASAYSSLSATTLVDVINKSRFKPKTPELELQYTKGFTIFWAVFSIIVASFAQKLGSSMIELVNILGSWFYGIILGIFLAAFYVKQIKSQALLYSAILSQILVILIWKYELVAFLWLNPIGVILVLSIGLIFQKILSKKNE
ncbi:MAG: sodium:solute symporter [Cytophagaceae bacterium]|nr:sodium:solute symporter [Cytophagaceae bacterium]MBK9936156.1 sodium:solute symporter [Cytophagaceae bacterium]MBL0303957.1 sodium:solute symporter [Cytophagaceae bacterium]MBL0326770.1 sodium:solute symporter [Cytophagaceae bacterium]